MVRDVSRLMVKDVEVAVASRDDDDNADSSGSWIRQLSGSLRGKYLLVRRT